MSARKIGMLILLLAAGGAIETAWQVKGHWQIGPQGCRVMGGRFYGPSFSFEQAEERAIGPAPQLTVKNSFGAVSVAPGNTCEVKRTPNDLSRPSPTQLVNILPVMPIDNMPWANTLGYFATWVVNISSVCRGL